MNEEKVTQEDEEAEEKGGDAGEKGGAKKHERSQNRKNWIKNAIIGLMDQKGIFQLAIEERHALNLEQIQPLIKEGKFIA